MPSSAEESTTTALSRLQCIQESATVRALLGGTPPFATSGYDPEITSWDFVRVLTVGAGGIGCELLHLLALSGFGSLAIVDMDTIELSNLNRQFLFREEDIGKPKSYVAAQRVMERCPGVAVEGVFGRIEEQSDAFYQSFDVVVMGLDSVPARRWMNRKVAELATWEVFEEAEGNSPSISEATPQRGPPAPAAWMRITRAIPIIETGTEGLQGHVKFIDMAQRYGSCIECMMWMYEKQRKQVPMCTLENIPRIPEHCVLYVQFKEWPEAHKETEEPLDGDNVSHIRWVTERARARQERFGIGGAPIDEVFTLGVVKNVVPAVSFTNAMVAGMAVTELMKWLTGVAPTLDNYYLYDGAGISTDVMVPGSRKLGGSETCPVCGPRRVLSLTLRMTPSQVREALVAAAPPEYQHNEEARAAALDGTLSLQYRDDLQGGAVKEVFLVFKAGSPLAVPIEGGSLGEVLAHSGAQSLLNAWQNPPSRRAGNEEEEESRPLAVMAMLTASRGTTITMPVRCCHTP